MLRETGADAICPQEKSPSSPTPLCCLRQEPPSPPHLRKFVDVAPFERKINQMCHLDVWRDLVALWSPRLGTGWASTARIYTAVYDVTVTTFVTYSNVFVILRRRRRCRHVLLAPAKRPNIILYLFSNKKVSTTSRPLLHRSPAEHRLFRDVTLRKRRRQLQQHQLSVVTYITESNPQKFVCFACHKIRHHRNICVICFCVIERRQPFQISVLPYPFTRVRSVCMPQDFSPRAGMFSWPQRGDEGFYQFKLPLTVLETLFFFVNKCIFHASTV